MKYFLFVITFLSCKEIKKDDSYKADYDSTISPVKDSRKGRNALVQGAPGLSDERDTPLNQFFRKNIDQSGLQFYKPEELVYSGDIIPGKDRRIDSIYNKDIEIIQLADTKEGTTINLRINGHNFRQPPWADALEFNMDAFRHFKFHGKAYYYLQGSFMNSFGGSMGNVKYHIIYMLGSKEINYFASCRFDKTFCFGDADGDDKLDYLHFENEDFCTTVPWSDKFIVNLYSCNSEGKFDIQKDKKGTAYYIDGNSGNDFAQDSFNISKKYWPLKIK